MARQKQEPTRRPATTDDNRENQLVSLAMDLAERQIRDGTASSQVITHYLKAGSRREALERKRLASENQVLQAKVEAMASGKRVEELYGEALAAMRRYSGQEDVEYDDYD